MSNASTNPQFFETRSDSELHVVLPEVALCGTKYGQPFHAKVYTRLGCIGVII